MTSSQLLCIVEVDKLVTISVSMEASSKIVNFLNPGQGTFLCWGMAILVK